MITTLEHIFIDTIPDELEDGILYISTRFRVIMHSCCCGCKGKVITPLSPVRWEMIFDGKTVSLSPSIGNWNFKCQSHYWIKNSKVKWAGKWSPTEIEEGKSYERKKRVEYHIKTNEAYKVEISNNTIFERSNELKNKSGFFNSLKIFFRKITNR